MIQSSTFACFVADGIQNNSIFNLLSSGNRDGCYAPYVLLKKKFSSKGINLNTSDLISDASLQFELHLDTQKSISCNNLRYLILQETPHVKPSNHVKDLINKYRIVFTWRDDLVDGKTYIKLNIPNQINIPEISGWDKHSKLCCLISSNKSLPNFSSLDLYSQRVATIRWFEEFAPNDFDLYGQGWDKPQSLPGLYRKLKNRLHKYLSTFTNKVHFPSYRGKVVSKHETLQNYRFSICYENVKDLPGYITEKIFDSFFAGCIPVYWGASNIHTYIPEDCFIDRRKFSSHEDLYDFMKSMTENEFLAYQERIASFLTSEKAKPFSAETFADTIVSSIMRDLQLAN